MSEYILEAKKLYKKFNLKAGLFARYGQFVYAVNGVSLAIKKNEIYGLVGESGCGKTTLARLIVRMYKHDEGGIVFNGSGDSINFNEKKKSISRDIRSKIKYIFQDPAKSLNPRMTVFNILTSGYKYAPSWPGKKKALIEASEIMEDLGLSPGDLKRRPADFSGGQRQRISIGRALIMKPEFLICDEVVSALDVSIQSQILKLLLEIKAKYKLSILFIAHDLTVVSYLCDRIAVMYGGRIMEEGSAKDLIKKRYHPYTRMLYSSISSKRSDSGSLKNLTFFNPTTPLSGCPFYSRCTEKKDICKSEIPESRIIKKGHSGACHFIKTE